MLGLPSAPITVCTALGFVAIGWALLGYSLAFGKTHGGLIGGTEHVLLGLIREGEGLAARVLVIGAGPAGLAAAVLAAGQALQQRRPFDPVDRDRRLTGRDRLRRRPRIRSREAAIRRRKSLLVVNGGPASPGSISRARRLDACADHRC